jgi:hypothetical protein
MFLGEKTGSSRSYPGHYGVTARAARHGEGTHGAMPSSATWRRRRGETSSALVHPSSPFCFVQPRDAIGFCPVQPHLQIPRRPDDRYLLWGADDQVRSGTEQDLFAAVT